MKIEIEIPDEDFRKLEETKGFMEVFPPNFNFRDAVRSLLEISCKNILKKVYEGYLLVESGAADSADILMLMTDDSIKMSMKVLKKQYNEMADKEAK